MKNISIQRHRLSVFHYIITIKPVLEDEIRNALSSNHFFFYNSNNLLAEQITA